jgi:nucleoside-diphosphate-sugar epimerase
MHSSERHLVERVLITGGSGFIGAWVVKRLAARGIEARIFDINPNRTMVAEIAGEQLARELDWRTGDIRITDDVAKAGEGCDGVIHMAGVLTPACRANPVRGAEINLIGTLNVFEAAKKHGFPAVVYASSAGVYGPDDPKTPRPTTLYGAYKLAGEGAARAYWADHKLPSVALRPFVVYGPGREVGLSAGPSLAARAAAWGEPYVHPFTGSSGLIYVDDVAAIFERALTMPLAGASAYNLIGEVATVEQVLLEIRRNVPDARLSQSGPPLPIAAGVEEEGLNEFMPERPRTSLAAGIKQTIDYYRQHRPRDGGGATLPR